MDPVAAFLAFLALWLILSECVLPNAQVYVVGDITSDDACPDQTTNPPDGEAR